MIYISGKITGTTDYMQRFNEAELRLKDCGYDVVNPASVNSMLPEGTPYECYMDTSKAMLKYCDTIYMLKGWQYSKGACQEREWAQKWGHKIIYEAEKKA